MVDGVQIIAIVEKKRIEAMFNVPLPPENFLSGKDRSPSVKNLSGDWPPGLNQNFLNGEMRHQAESFYARKSYQAVRAEPFDFAQESLVEA